MADVLTRRTLAFIGSCLLCSAQGTRSRAQDGESYGAHARIRAPVAATSSEDATASGTALQVETRVSALESVADVLADAPGVRIESTGGFGSFTGVTLRGAELAHTTVLLGDIPLNTPDTGAFDLSLVPLEALEAVEIYRGGAPIWWSDGAIGGVVRLVPKRAKHGYLQARAGAGSFGHFELSGTSSLMLEGGSVLSVVGYARADNDYSYPDDNQTRFTDDDDTTLEQQNAEIDTGNGLMHASIDALGGRVDVVATGHGRVEGVPGPLAAPTDHVSRKLVRVLGALAYTREGLAKDGSRSYRVQALASASHQKNQLTDLDSELGLTRARATDDDWSRAYGRLAGSVAATSFLEPTVVLSAARDDYEPENPLDHSVPSRPSGRSTQAAAFELRLHGRAGDAQLELRPSVRGQWTQASIWMAEDSLESRRYEDRDEALATYRIAGLVAPLPALTLSASYSTGARVPSILELFGDRVSIERSLELKAERSRAADVSAVLKGRAGSVRGSIELRGFVLFIDDLINYVRTSQYAVRAENTASGEILGVELGMTGAVGRHFALYASGTAMRTRNQFDREVPLRPPLLAQVRPEVSLFPSFADRIALFAEIEHTSFMYLDPTNRTLLEARTLFGVGGMVELFSQSLTLSARIQNLTDQAATDVLSRPLPGVRALFSVSGQSSLL
jgi:outer membrane cobalamin receptor